MMETEKMETDVILDVLWNKDFLFALAVEMEWW
jgi:hypothetical protein